MQRQDGPLKRIKSETCRKIHMGPILRGKASGTCERNGSGTCGERHLLSVILDPMVVRIIGKSLLDRVNSAWDVGVCQPRDFHGHMELIYPCGWR